MEIKAIVFDLGEVLIKLNFSKIMELKNQSITSTQVAINRMNEWRLYDAFERGILTEIQFLDCLNQEFSTIFSMYSFRELWNSVLGETVPGTETHLKLLSQRYPLFALTNSNETHINFLRSHYPWVQYFESILSSHELHCRKPEPLIYEKLITIAKTPAEQILFLDDRMENIRGAREMGIQAAHCPNPETDIPKILKQFSIHQTL